MPVNPIAQQVKIPLIGAVGHNAFVPGNPYTYQSWPSAQDEATFLAKEFIKQGLKRVAMIYSEDEWTQSVVHAFREAYPKHGGTFVFEQSVLTTETDFRSLLTKIRRTTPDALYFNVVISQIAPLFRQAYELRLTGERFSNFYVGKREVIEATGVAVVEGIQYADINTSLPALHKKLGLSESELIPAVTLASYLATTLLAQAASESTDTSAQAIAAALERQKSVALPDASYEIQGRYIILPLTLRRLHST
jgi:ABC-type branched-subunit amino acid transport system substrate-binding protein